MRIRGYDLNGNALYGMQVRVFGPTGRQLVTGKTTRPILGSPHGYLQFLRQFRHNPPPGFEFTPMPAVDTLRIEAKYKGHVLEKEVPPSSAIDFHFDVAFPMRSRTVLWGSLAMSGALLSVCVGLMFFHSSVDPERGTRNFNAENAWIKQSDPPSPLLVIFVHGIFGSGSDSWSSSTGVSFPKLMVQDEKISPRPDVLVYQYSSPYLQNAGRINDIAQGLEAYLDDQDVWRTHRSIIFIGHSMGGLVIRRFLDIDRKRASQVPMIFLYATPTNGAEIANSALRLSKNSALRGLLPLDGKDMNQFLDNLQTDWRKASELKSIPTYCAFEEQDTDGIRVVSQTSASALCNDVEPLNYNHSEIIKPRSLGDDRYVAARNKLLETLARLGQDTP